MALTDQFVTYPVFKSGLSQFKTNADNTYVIKGEETKYTVKKQAEADAGFSATYQFVSIDKDGTETPVGDKINLAKDIFIKKVSETPITVTEEDKPVAGYKVGDKYIDFEFSVTPDGGSDHMYLLLSDLVQTYVPADGINIDADNKVSVKIDAANANGLAVDEDGLRLDLATADTLDEDGVVTTPGTNGAISANDLALLRGISVVSSEEVTNWVNDLFA